MTSDNLTDEYIQLFKIAKKRFKHHRLTELVKNSDISIGTINKFSRASSEEDFLSFRVNTIANIFSLIDKMDKKTNKKYNQTLICMFGEWFKKLNKGTIRIIGYSNRPYPFNMKQIQSLNHIKTIAQIKRCSFNIKSMLYNYQKALIIAY